MRCILNVAGVVIVSLLHSVVGTESNNGTATTTFVTMDTLETITYSFYGEGMAYDTKRDRFILGSLQLGTLLAVPRSTMAGSNIHFAEKDTTKILSERPVSFNGSNFLGLKMDPVDPDLLWGCVSYGPNPSFGVARVNLSDSSVEFFDLSDMGNPETGDHAVLNDLALSSDGAYVFITDTWGYQILRMEAATGTAEVWSSGDVYCTDCLTTEPHFDGPNGIVYVSTKQYPSECANPGEGSNYSDDYLVVALGAGSKRLLKVNASQPSVSPAVVEVHENAGYIDAMDSIVMSDDAKTLFIAGNGVNSVFSLTSEDGWLSATVRATADANCPKYQPSALALVHDTDVACYCTNGFGPAPYPITLLTDAADRVRSSIGIQLALTDMAGEGIEYDQGVMDRIIVGSTTMGTIRGFSNTGSSGVQLTEAETYTYFTGGGVYSILSTKGMKVDTQDPCLLWVAVNSDPIGIATINICTADSDAEPQAFIDLSTFSNPVYGSSPNDIAIVNHDLYVTDFQGGYIWKIANANSAAYKISVYLEVDPAENRPNGIEVVDNILLISLFDSNILMRANLDSGATTAVSVSPPGVFAAGDGLRFNRDKDILYVARHNDNSVIALISCDDWEIAIVANDFFADCTTPTGGSPVVTTLALASGDLWLFCSDNYGPGPYGFNRISNISGMVNSGASVCIVSSDTSETDFSSEDDDDDSGVYLNNPFLWSTVGLSIFGASAALYFYIFYWGARKEDMKISHSLL